VCVCVCVLYGGVSEKHLRLRGGALHADDRASKSVSKHVLRPRRHKFVRRSLIISRFYLHVCRRVRPCLRRLHTNYAFRFIAYTESSSRLRSWVGNIVESRVAEDREKSRIFVSFEMASFGAFSVVLTVHLNFRLSRAA